MMIIVIIKSEMKLENIDTHSTLGHNIKRLLVQIQQNKEKNVQQTHQRFQEGRTLIKLQLDEKEQLRAQIVTVSLNEVIQPTKITPKPLLASTMKALEKVFGRQSAFEDDKDSSNDDNDE